MKQIWKRIGSVLLSTSIILTLLPTMAFAADIAIDETNFPDANFRAWLIENNGGHDAILTESDIEHFKHMTLPNQGGISSLEGIQFFTNLEALVCCDNNLSELPELPTTLTSLNFSDNNLTELPDLPSGLLMLTCNDNDLSEVPVLPSGLISLICNDNSLTAIPTLPSSLRILVCNDNSLTAIPSLPSSLNVLICNNNSLSALTLNDDTTYVSINVSNNLMKAESDVTGNSITWDGTDFIFSPQKDTTPPVLSSGSSSRMTEYAGSFTFTTDEAGTVYYKMVDSGAAAPTKADIVNGGTTFDVGAVAAVTHSLTLTAEAKDVYVVVKDEANNISEPLKIEIAATQDLTSPILSNGIATRTSDTEAIVYFITDEAGTAYYTAVDKDASAPNKADVAAGTSLGAVYKGTIEKEITLNAGAKDIYVVVEDGAHNISDPLEMQVGAYVSPIQTVANKLTALGFSAAVNGSTITVSGRKTGVTEQLSFEIPDGVTVKWGAELTGAVEHMALLSVANKGSLEIVSGAELTNNANMGITLDLHQDGNLLVSGGTILFTGSRGYAISVRDGGVCVIKGGRVSTGMSSDIYQLMLDGALAVISNEVPIDTIATDNAEGASTVVRVAAGLSGATIGSAEGLSVTSYNLDADDSLTTQWLTRSGVVGINVLKNKSSEYWFAPYSGVSLHTPSTVNSVTVTPTTVSVKKGATYQFNATVNGTSNPDQAVAWSVIGGTAGTSISASGLLTVVAAESSATLTVRATSTADTTKSGTATVTVVKKGGSGSSSGGGTTPSTTKQEANVTGGNSPIKTEIKTDTKAGNASVELTAAQIESGKKIAVTLPKITGMNSYGLGIPVSGLSSESGSGSVTMNTNVGNITLPSNMLMGMDIASGSKAQVSIGTVKTADLPKDAQDKVGSHPIVSLSLTIDGKTTAWNNSDAAVTVSIPYTPTAEELKNPDSITVFYIDGSDNLVEMTDAKYDVATKRIVFTTTHFSYYAVGYKATAPSEVTVSSETFSDVPSSAWYYDAVNFIAEKGVATGMEDGKFGPEVTLTRGQFIVMLLKAYDIEVDKNITDNFVDAGNTYYTAYLATAKAEGITGGIGNNKFAPDQAITRQEMFTLLYNALKVIDQIPQGDSGKTVTDFSDASQIDDWAREPMTAFTKNGIVSGNDGKLNPHSTTTRAEMAQVLYKLLEN